MTSRSDAAVLARIDELETEAYELRAQLGGDAYVAGQVSQLGVCGCGEPELVIASLALYLRRQVALQARAPSAMATMDTWRAFSEALGAEFRQDPVAEMWAAYTADRLEFTAHGGGVSSAWLTDKGRAWLANWETAQRADSLTT